MPSGSDSPNQSKQSSEDIASESVVEATECPNCGREFEGTYCPDCGQKSNPSVAVTDVVGDFTRELVDIEGGFQATVIGLTLRPAEVLKQYLRGARVGLMSPGRYLLASVVISYVAQWVLVGTGTLQTPGAYLDSAAISETDEQVAKAYAEAIPQIYQSQWFGVGITLVTAGLFALVLRRLLSDEIPSGAEALASSAFLVGHATVLGAGGLFLLVPLLSLSTGEPVAITTQSAVALLVMIIYVGAAIYGFHSAWKDVVKATLGVIWVQIETIAAANLVALGYALWSVTSSGTLSPEGAVFLGVLGMLYALPFLCHAGVEAYYRLR